jgi:hypothetical protein
MLDAALERAVVCLADNDIHVPLVLVDQRLPPLPLSPSLPRYCNAHFALRVRSSCRRVTTQPKLQLPLPRQRCPTRSEHHVRDKQDKRDRTTNEQHPIPIHCNLPQPEPQLSLAITDSGNILQQKTPATSLPH